MSRKAYVDERTLILDVEPAAAFAPVQRIGGKNGWYYANWLWRLRGLLDVLVGGPGMKPGRKHESAIEVGDLVDWWVVERFEPGRLLRLSSRMKVPGLAWLEFEVQPHARGCRIRQRAGFQPSGLLGYIYWFGLLPIHDVIFSGLLRALGRAAREGALLVAPAGPGPGWTTTPSEELNSGSD